MAQASSDEGACWSEEKSKNPALIAFEDHEKTIKQRMLTRQQSRQDDFAKVTQYDELIRGYQAEIQRAFDVIIMEARLNVWELDECRPPFKLGNYLARVRHSIEQARHLEEQFAEQQRIIWPYCDYLLQESFPGLKEEDARKIRRTVESSWPFDVLGRDNSKAPQLHKHLKIASHLILITYYFLGLIIACMWHSVERFLVVSGEKHAAHAILACILDRSFIMLSFMLACTLYITLVRAALCCVVTKCDLSTAGRFLRYQKQYFYLHAVPAVLATVGLPVIGINSGISAVVYGVGFALVANLARELLHVFMPERPGYLAIIYVAWRMPGKPMQLD